MFIGGPEFIHNLHPICNLTAQFLCSEAVEIMQAVESDSEIKF